MKTKLLKIINHYGIKPQLKKFNEECFELIESIRELENTIECADCVGANEIAVNKEKANVISELADVCVMLNQIKEYYDLKEEDIYSIMEFKVERQLRRIEDGE